MTPNQASGPYKKRDWSHEGRKRTPMEEMQYMIRKKIAAREAREAEEEEEELKAAIELSLATEVAQEDPQGYPFPGYDPSAPFDFERLPHSIRHRILYHATPHHTIAPYYNTGSVQASYEATKDLTNIDIASITHAIGNKSFYYAATAAFYGNSVFTFNDPTLALWWMKRIGSNLRKVREIRFNLGDGEVKPSMSVRSERVWQLLSTWLKPRHKLDSIIINTKAWRTRSFRDYDPLREPSTFVARHNVMRTLLKFRGLTDVRIVPGRWVNAFEAGVLERAMLLKDGEETRDDIERYEERLGRQLAWELRGDTR